MPTPYEIALTQLGTKETPGPADNPKVDEYFTATNLGSQHDSVAWCSAFVNWCCKQAGIQGTDRANARSWLTWGVPVQASDLKQGDIVVFARGTDGYSGHVAFIAQPPGLSPLLKILGGNQNDSVCYETCTRVRVLGYRRAA